ncbi:TPA: hypothetical protein ACGU88_000907 [Vibrio vulnificus]|uniref:hypothetical protein n=1 Tax=Vibrio vulnificus TaxID=672 RepID=UPI0028930BF8|nr:hypothetical protein [Vibrio vulnificus]WNJ72087.1 hypothetical protein RI132_20345 [Vibrio vulnificus]
MKHILHINPDYVTGVDNITIDETSDKAVINMFTTEDRSSEMVNVLMEFEIKKYKKDIKRKGIYTFCIFFGDEELTNLAFTVFDDKKIKQEYAIKTLQETFHRRRKKSIQIFNEHDGDEQFILSVDSNK